MDSQGASFRINRKDHEGFDEWMKWDEQMKWMEKVLYDNGFKYAKNVRPIKPDIDWGDELKQLIIEDEFNPKGE